MLRKWCSASCRFFHSFGYTVTRWLPMVVGFGAAYHPNPTDANTIGEMVPHMRVEEQLQALLQEPYVCVVTAVPDHAKGERLVALYTDPGMTPQTICEGLSRSDLPKLWIPKRADLHLVDAIPTLGTGKVDLRGVRLLAVERSA